MTRPMTTRPLFVTLLYEASLAGEKGFETFIDDLHDACIAVAEDDEAGQAWAEKKGYLGCTSTPRRTTWPSATACSPTSRRSSTSTPSPSPRTRASTWPAASW